MPTAQIVGIIHKTGWNIVESEVLVLPVHSRESSRLKRDSSRFSRDESREKRDASRETVVTYF